MPIQQLLHGDGTFRSDDLTSSGIKDHINADFWDAKHRRWAFACLALASCGGDTDIAADDRPLAQRATSVVPAAINFSAPWWRDAIEASPAIEWFLDGRLADNADLLVIGPVISVEGLGSLRDPGVASVRESDYLEFHAAEASTDFVGVTVRVGKGVAEANGPVPETVTIVLALPTPTGVPSLERELRVVDSVAAIAFRMPYLPASAASVTDADIFRPLGSYFFAPVVDGRVESGTYYPSSDFYSARSVPVAGLVRGAGRIDVVSHNGGVVRLAE